MNRIKRVSFIFRVIFQICLVSVLIGQMMGWFCAPELTDLFNTIPAAYQQLVPAYLSPSVRVLGFLVTLVPSLIEAAVFYYLIRLFKHYERYEIFTLESVMCIRKAGYALLISQLVNPFFDFILGFILTASNPPGFRVASLTMNSTNFKIILGACIIILVSWVMTEACRLHEDQQLTI